MEPVNRSFKGVWIPKELWITKELTLQEKCFLVEINSLDNDEGCFASNAYFAEFFGLSIGRVKAVMANLEKKGYITRELIYKEGTREVEKRIIHVVGKSLLGGAEVTTRGSAEMCPDNNINNNNIDYIYNSGTKNHEQQNNILSKELLQRIIDKWNTVSTNKIKGIKPNTQRYSMLKERLKEYGEDSVIEAIDNVGKSSFLKGRNNRNWTIDFDWFVRPNNFPKVLEGRYADKTTVTSNRVESTTDNEGGDWIGNM